MRSKFTKELIKGTFYTGLAKYLSIIISILVTAVLSRILTPDDFGTVAIATVFIGLITLFTGSGLSPAIIQNRNLNKDALSHIFSFTVYLACFGMVLYLLLAPLISFFLSK